MGDGTYSVVSFYLGCELKYDMKDSLKIGRMTILESGFELNFLCSLNGCFIQSMTEALHYSLDANLTIGCKHNLQQNFAFDFKAASFFGVNGTRLECDLSGNRLCTRFGCFGS